MTLHPTGAEILRRRGADLDALDLPPEPRFDLVSWRLEQAQQIIADLVPTRFADAQPDHPDVTAWVRRYIADPGTCPSLLLSGPTGTGKTWQMFGALKVILVERAHRAEGLSFRVTSQPDLNDAMRPKPDGSNAWALEPYLTTHLLLLDDLGAGKQTDWTGDSLYRLVDHRWANSLPSIFTTNLTAANLTAAVGDRIVSRLADAVRVPMKGADRRWAGGQP
jgi:DNA replication protein DnaC